MGNKKGAVLAGLVAALSACSSGSASHVLSGYVYDEAWQLHPFGEAVSGIPGQPCETEVHANWQAGVEDESGHLLSVAPIATTGVFALSPTTGVDSCKVQFALDGVGKAKIYQVGVEGYRPVDFTAAQLAATHWTASIPIAS